MNPNRNVIIGLVLLTGLSVVHPARVRGQTAERLPACETCPAEGLPVMLLPGGYRAILPSPDGSLLAVYGGPGEPGREHTVSVLERDCTTGSVTSVLNLSASARFVEPPSQIPVPYVLLTWSEDGRWLYAAGDVYRLNRNRDGLLTAKKVRKLDQLFLDFRFGPGGKAAAVEMVEGKRRKVRSSGEDAYTVTLGYMMVMLNREAELAITPRDRMDGFWVVEDSARPPAIQWEPDGSLLIYYPLNDLVERFLPGKKRDLVEGLYPDPWLQAGSGPFTVVGDCKTTWRLESDDRSDRVFLSVE